MEILFDIAEKYGIWGVAGLVFCMIMFLLTKWLSKKLSDDMSTGLEKIGEKLTDQMSNQNDKLVNTIIDQQGKLFEHILDEKNNAEVNHANMLTDRINLTEEINTALRDIMHIHNAQRAFIIEFHNSYKNLSGVPFAKYSCTFEWFDKGLVPFTSKCQGLPFSTMSRIVSDLLKAENNQIVYNDLNKMEEENPQLFSMLSNENELPPKAVVYNCMFDNYNTLIGLLVLEYKIPLEKGHLNLDQLKIQTAEVTSLLNIRYKYSK